MSQPTEREDGLAFDADSVLDRVRELYHIPAVALLLAFMLWNRVKTWENFSSNGEFLFRGNDAWYHLRQTSYTVQNFPFTMPFDPWTNFPTGTASGQFGTLFDQLVALGALVLGIFMPQDQATTMALLFAPAVFGTLVATPAYFIARRFGGKLGGVIAVLVLALTPGAFLFRSLVGFSDHHIAEVLFQVLAVLGVMVAVSVAQRDLPVYEQFRAREFGALRSTVVYSVLAGVALGLYIWVWPPGVFFVSVLGLFFLVHAVFVFVKGHSPEHVAIAGIVMSVVAALLSAVKVAEFGFSASDFSLLQPMAFLGLAVGLAVVAGLARVVEGRDDAGTVFPLAIVGAIAAVALVAWLAVPDTFGYFVDQFLRVYGLDANAQVRTVREAQPIALEQAGEFFAARYGFTFFVAAVVALGALVTYLLDDDPRGEVLLLVTWFVLMVLATLTQNRFEYYLAVPVAVLTAFGVGVVARRLQNSYGQDDGISAAQVMVVFTVVLVVVAPFVAVSGPLTEGGIPLQSAQSAQSNGPGEVTQWDSSLSWLANSTPDEGQYGTENADNAQMEYYGTYERTDDYEYGPGTYGVMSWWDYGHFITVEGDRIPNANPFQQGANEAADFLLAQNESAATDILTTEGDGEGGRYVMIDWKLADPRSGKYTAPPAFGDHDITVSGTGENALIETLTYQQYFQGTQPQPQVYVRNQAHYDSMRTKLYQFHGSAASPQVNGQVIVVDWEVAPFSVNGQQTQPYPQNASIKRFATMEEAEEYVETDTTSQIGGLQGIPSEYVPALEQYRLVHASEEANQVGPWVKTFERVDGATIEGTGPANATVTASVQMRIPTQNGTQFERFTYYQQVQTGEDGSFSMTVPYSTTGYDEFGPENGHTNVSVRSTGDYRLSAVTQGEDLSRTIYGANATVTEAQVLGEDDGATQVTLEEERTIQAGGNQSGNGTNVTASPDGGVGGNGTDDSASNGTSDTNASGNGSANASTLAAPETVVARVA